MKKKTFVSMHFKGNDVTYKRDEINHDYDDEPVFKVIMQGSGECLSSPQIKNPNYNMVDVSWFRDSKGILTKNYDDYIDFED